MKGTCTFGTTGRWIRRIAIAAALFLSATGASAQADVSDPEFSDLLAGLLSHNVPEVSVPKAAARQGALFLDARAAKEYAVSHIPGATWVGDREFNLSALDSVPKDQPVIVYCSVGYRSEKISRKLLKAGFRDVSNLYGGIFEWVNQGHPVRDSLGETFRVHTFNRNWSKWLRRGERTY